MISNNIDALHNNICNLKEITEQQKLITSMFSGIQKSQVLSDIVAHNLIMSKNSFFMVKSLNSAFSSINPSEYSSLTNISNIWKNVAPIVNQRLNYSLFGVSETLKAFQTNTRQILGTMPLKLIDYLSTLSDIRKKVVDIFPEYEVSDDDIEPAEEADKKIVSSIINPRTNEPFNDNQKQLIITAFPINEKILKYIAENPQELFKLNPREFEKIMAEIYHRLGFEVELTQATRDGGKDIILTEHNYLGDFVYYAECKHHINETNKVGVGIIRGLYGTVTAKNVNGGIVATNSFFTKPAREFINDNNCKCKIKLHDKNYISSILKKITN